MRIAALLLLAVAASEDFRANYDPMVEAARWLTDGGEPPAHWVVHAKLDLDFVLAAKTKLGGRTKKVVEARYRNTSVVVKRTKEKLFKTKYGEGAVFAELLFLEYCRGGPGIPRLLGGYREDGQAVLVVEHMGLPIGASLGSYKGRPKGHRVTNLKWVAFAEAAPLDAARAIFRCFRSFTEMGGFFLKDFASRQFTFSRGSLYLVDGPAFADGPARDLVDKLREGEDYVENKLKASRGDVFEFGWMVIVGRQRHCRGEFAHPYKRDAARAPKKKTKLAGDDDDDDDDESYIPRGKPPEANNDHCAQTPPQHSCVGYSTAGCEPGSSAAPEAAGVCENFDASKDLAGRCVALTYKTHVYDVAAKHWLLPLVIGRSAGDDRAKLEALSAAMTRPDPDARPSFTELLAALG